MALADNLVAYYALDEASGNALDAHGLNDLTDTNTVGSGTGKVNGSRVFNGTNERFTIASNLFNGLSALSISVWMRNTSAAIAFDAACVIASLEFSSTGDGIRIELDGGATAKLRLRKSYGFATSYATADNGTVANTWYHVVGTISAGGAMTLYIDGVAQASTGSRSGTLTNTTATNIGSDDAVNAASHWPGDIDELALWSRDLTAGEVTELYNSGNGRDYAYIIGGAADPEGSLIGGKLIRGGLLLHGVLGR